MRAVDLILSVLLSPTIAHHDLSLVWWMTVANAKKKAKTFVSIAAARPGSIVCLCQWEFESN